MIRLLHPMASATLCISFACILNFELTMKHTLFQGVWVVSLIWLITLCLALLLLPLNLQTRGQHLFLFLRNQRSPLLITSTIKLLYPRTRLQTNDHLDLGRERTRKVMLASCIHVLCLIRTDAIFCRALNTRPHLV